MNYACALWLWMCMGVFAHAQNNTWLDTWKEAKLPPGWKYGTTDKSNVRDFYGIGQEHLLGRIVFIKNRNLQVEYYAYYTHDTADARKMIDKHRQHLGNQTCRKNNIPPGMSEFTAKAQGYTSYLQVDDVLYLIVDCHSAPCPYTYESQAFIRSLLKFMFRAEE